MERDELTRLPRVLLGLSGSVATVKWCELVLALSAFAEVRVVVTSASEHFQRISQTYNPSAWAQMHGLVPPIAVHTDKDEWLSYDNVHGDPVLHIELRRWADVMVIAPLSANTLAKIAGGFADNLLTSIVRAWELPGRHVADGAGDGGGARRGKPLLVAPAMNTEMWIHPLTAPQLDVLTATLGVTIIDPTSRTLACGDVGVGAMAAVQTIVERVRAAVGL